MGPPRGLILTSDNPCPFPRRPGHWCRTRAALLLVLAGAVAAAGPSCRRTVPPLNRLPQPPAELLVPLAEPREPRLSSALKRAAQALPPIDAYRETARQLRQGKRMEMAEALWPTRMVAQAVEIVRFAFRAVGRAWPTEPGGPDCDLDDVARLGDALFITAHGQGLLGTPDEGASICLDGLLLAAHVGMIPGPDAELTVQAVQGPLVAELQASVRDRRLSIAMLRRLLKELDGYRRSVRPLNIILREGLSQVVQSARSLTPAEWAATVQVMWRREPRRDPALALSNVWETWATLITASTRPLPEAQALVRGLVMNRDAIQIQFQPPPRHIIPGYAVRLRELDRLTLMVALALWRQAHGRYPDRLEQLVPSVLTRLPSMADSSSRLSYRRDGNGYDLSLTVQPGPGS